MVLWFRGLLTAAWLELRGIWRTSRMALGSAGLYTAKCAMGHGADGKGETPMAKGLGSLQFHFASSAETE